MKIEGVNFFMRMVAGISAATSARREGRNEVSSRFGRTDQPWVPRTSSVEDGNGSVELSSYESSGLGKSSRSSVSDLEGKKGGTVEVSSPLDERS